MKKLEFTNNGSRVHSEGIEDVSLANTNLNNNY
jgi:hypothetical protein